MKTKQKMMRLVILMILSLSFLTSMAQGPYPKTGNQSVCLNSNQPYGVINTPGSTYAWSILPGTGGNGIITGNGNSSITILWTNVGTDTLQVIETLASGCVGPPVKIMITVHPIPDVNYVDDLIFCAGATTNTITFTGSVPGTTFAWTGSNSTIGCASSGTDSVPSFVTINTGIVPIVDTITVIPTADSCVGTPMKFTITVNPTTTVNPIANVAYCNGAITAIINFSSPVSGTTYTWTGSNSTIGLATSGIDFIPSFTATNPGTAPVVDTITVTPTANNCVGTPLKFTITVNPSTTVNPVANVAYCDGATTTTINFSSPVSGTTYAWTNSDPSIGLAASGTDSIPSFIATNPGTVPVIATITVTPTANGCQGTPITFTITVNPRPVPTISGNTPVCLNSSGNIYTTETGMTNYTWTITGGTIDSGNGTNSISVTWTATGVQTITVTYTNLTGCNPLVPTSFNVTVNVLPNTSPIYHN
jgi:hypothetical protein